MNHLRSYKLSITFYRAMQTKQLCVPFGDQLRRASSSVCLNLAEGTGKRTLVDQRRFFYIALGSLREIRAIFDLNFEKFCSEDFDQLDHLSASVYKLCNWRS